MYVHLPSKARKSVFNYFLLPWIIDVLTRFDDLISNAGDTPFLHKGCHNSTEKPRTNAQILLKKLLFLITAPVLMIDAVYHDGRYEVIGCVRTAGVL